MIHNITVEREKRKKQDAFPADAFTEEELLRLIEQVEEREMIHAPMHLKGDVFQRIGRERERERNRRLFSYRVKVLAGMAAALTVLLLLPIEGRNVSERPKESFVNELLRGGEKSEEDTLEQASLARGQEIDRAWERYRKKQERKDAGEWYLLEMKAYFRNNFEWEDQ